MSNELMEAALALVAISEFQYHGSAKLSKVVAEAYLAEHRADDGLPYDTQWLNEIGFKDDDTDKGEFLWINNTKSGNVFDLQYWYTMDRWVMADADNEIVVKLATRGDVRRLARGLKIDLGE